MILRGDSRAGDNNRVFATSLELSLFNELMEIKSTLELLKGSKDCFCGNNYKHSTQCEMAMKNISKIKEKYTKTQE